MPAALSLVPVVRSRAKRPRTPARAPARRFSPGLYALEVLDLARKFRELGVRTVLDAGCGSGRFMKRLLLEHGADFAVRGFDLPGTRLDPWFDGRESGYFVAGSLADQQALPAPNDAIVCNEVLEHLPSAQIPGVLRNLRAAARRCVFVAIALPSGGGGAPLHVASHSADWWRVRFRDSGLATISGAVLHSDDDDPPWLCLLCRPAPAVTA